MEVPLAHDSLVALDPQLLRAYLSSQGWRPEETARVPAAMQLWETTDPETHEAHRVLVPENPTYDDYGTRVAEALRVVARSRGETPGFVMAEVLGARADVVRFASQAEVRADGSVPVQDGMRFLKGIQDTLKASAKARQERRSYYGNLYWDRAKAFLQSARLGQTEVGSYVVTIWSRVPGGGIEVDEATGQLTVPGAPRGERFIIETLMQSLEAARGAIDEYSQSGDTAAFQDAVDAGVSSDLCSAIAALAEGSGGTGVKVAVTWSPLLAVSEDAPTEVAFKSQDAGPLEVGAESLRLVEVQSEARVSGWVERLHREQDGRGPGVITLVSDAQSEQLSIGNKLRIALDVADYDRAVSAHRQSTHIALVGDLVHESGRNWLHNARITGLSAGDSGDSLPLDF